MKPSLQQEDILRKYLSGILKYKETIDEGYDHVMSAVEDKSENTTFQNAVNEILNEDFGGGKGLVKIEKQHLKNAIWEAVVQLIRNVKANILFPNIFATIILYMAVYYAISSIMISHFQIALIFMLNALFFLAFSWVRKFLVGYITKDTRKSIQDIVVERIMYIPYWILIYPLIFSFYQQNFLFLLINYPSIVAGVATVYFLFISATIKICFDEFKPYLQKN